MAFQTGTFTSAADLIATVKSFATSNGWTVSGDVIYKGTVYSELTVLNTGTVDFIRIRGGTGELAGALTGASTGNAYLLGMAGPVTFSFPGTYWLFDSTAPNTLICIVRSNEGLYFNWLLFGMLNKYGTYTGGEFFGASFHRAAEWTYSDVRIELDRQSSGGSEQSAAPFWSMAAASGNLSTNVYVRSDVGLESGAWLGETDPSNNSAHANRGGGSLIKRNPNVWNNQTVLVPYIISTQRASGFYSKLGNFSAARLCRITNFAAGDIVTLGSDKYMVFPFYRKNTEYPDGFQNPNGANASGTLGWAIVYDGP